MSPNTKQPRVISFGLTPEELEPIQKHLQISDVTSIPLVLANIFSASRSPHPSIIFCNTPKDFSVLEAAQLLRSQFQDSKIYYFESNKTGFTHKELKNNGFDEVILNPTDWDSTKTIIQEAIIQSSNASSNYRAMKLIDIDPGTALKFDTAVYLPTNQKYVKISTAGDTLDQKRIDQLFNKKHENIYVSLDQLPEFYEHTAKRLRELGSTPEGLEQRMKAVQNIVSTIFETTEIVATNGSKISQDCREIVRSYIDQSKGTGWYDQLIKTVQEKRSVYSHGSNVSSYAAIFSLGTGIGNPEELGAAGLLHDIGFCLLPKELQDKSIGSMTEPELALYQDHPAHAVKILKELKVDLSENVYKIILQHHEKYNGKGFPHGLSGKNILPEAQLLSIADRFDYLTAVKDGKMQMTPLDAANIFLQEKAREENRQDIDPEVMGKVLKIIFGKDTK